MNLQNDSKKSYLGSNGTAVAPPHLGVAAAAAYVAENPLPVAAVQLVPRTATSKICGNKWPVRNLLKDLSRSHLCFENSFDLSYKICHL